MLSLVLVFSAYMLVDGVFAIISAVRAARRQERWWLVALEGTASIAAGAIALLWPGITLIAFVLLVAAWAIISGALMFAAAFRLRKNQGRWWLGLGGVVSILFGALLIAAPLAGAVALTWWVGAYAIAFGVALLVLAFKLKRQRERPAGNAVGRAAA
jgi:uncharacterized membrane protein HdeD (DUF308 family)